MAEVLLFHHILGLTPGVAAFAEALRTAGHTVHTPDLFDGHTFGSIEEGAEFAGNVGFGTLIDRGVAEADGLPDGLVYAGFSLGVLPAQKLAQTRPGARGALFFHSCLPPTEFSAGWPPGVPIQIHGMDNDPFFVGEGDVDAAKAIVESAPDAELFLYPGDRHLFAELDQPSFDLVATQLLTQRALDFLRRVG